MGVRVPSGRTVPPAQHRATVRPDRVRRYRPLGPQLRRRAPVAPGGRWRAIARAGTSRARANERTRGGEVAMPQTSPPTPDPSTPDPPTPDPAAPDPARARH